ncbi:MAG: nucleolar RNA-binding Nop10p family protein, partial [Promethearchaeota archaeon]
MPKRLKKCRDCGTYTMFPPPCRTCGSTNVHSVYPPKFSLLDKHGKY